jgi:hypothetical protein
MHVRKRRRGGTRRKDVRVSRGWSSKEKSNLLALALLQEFRALQTLELDSGERQLLVDTLLCAFAARRGLGNAGRRKHDAVEADGANVLMGVDGWRDRSLGIAEGRAAAQHTRQRLDIGLSRQEAASGQREPHANTPVVTASPRAQHCARGMNAQAPPTISCAGTS